jgi:hypothetical protein
MFDSVDVRFWHALEDHKSELIAFFLATVTFKKDPEFKKNFGKPQDGECWKCDGKKTTACHFVCVCASNSSLYRFFHKGAFLSKLRDVFGPANSVMPARH